MSRVTQEFDTYRFCVKKLNKVDVRENYQPGISKSLADLKNLDDSRNTGLGKILQRVQKNSAERSLSVRMEAA